MIGEVRKRMDVPLQFLQLILGMTTFCPNNCLDPSRHTLFISVSGMFLVEWGLLDIS
jgi:hypothetical protein